MTSPVLAAIRRMRPADLILPAGAVLVSLGLQALDDRERRARAKLDELGALVDEHLSALRNAGAEVPDDLAALEQHPLDHGVPWLWLGQHAGAAGDKPAPARPRRRAWKLAAIALAGVACGVAVRHRDEIAAALLARLDPDGTLDAALAEQADRAGQLDVDDLADPHPLADVDDLADVAAAGESVQYCGWFNCDWRSDPGQDDQTQRTAAALHRNRCTFRPSGAQVAG